MSDYTEWGEGTAGTVTADGSGGDDFDFDDRREQVWQRNERDAVVCLVDCSESMFGVPAHTEARNGLGASGPSTAVKQEPPSGAASFSAAANADQATGAKGQSFFSMTMQSVHRLLTEKIVCSNKDVVAVVLYNTRASSASAGFRGVFVVQDATRIGTECIQRVEQLQAAGVRGSAAYEEFVDRIGHWPAAAAGSNTVSATASPAFKFSEALWVTQRILLGIGNTQTIRHRRLLVFTNADDPTSGDAREWNQCCSRARDLGKEGVVLEVFGFGDAHAMDTAAASGTAGGHPSAAAAAPQSTVSSATAPSSRPLFAVTNTLGQTLDPSAFPVSTTTGSAAVAASSSFTSATATTASLGGRTAAGFGQEYFWAPLLKEMQPPAAPFSTPDADPSAATIAALDEAAVSGGVGAVYVNAGARTLQQLLGTVVRRAHPQRPFRHCFLRIGGGSLADSAEVDATTATVAVPRMAVSLYTPIMRARPAQHEWLDARTNRMLRRVVHLRAASRNDGTEAGDDDERSGANAAPVAPEQHGEEVSRRDIRHYAQVGKERVYFTGEERKRIADVAAAGAEPGFTVLLFKPISDAIKHAQVVRRSSFLHACAQRGGQHSHRLFVLFVRRLRAADKAAIAQYRSSATAAPRLVALVPSPDLTAHPEKLNQVPVEGLGLYVVPLPYAEELRPVPELATCTLVNRSAAPCLEDTTVDADHLELAQRVVSALSVSYQTDAVLNPALQRQYRKLQDLARRLFPLADEARAPAASGSAFAKVEEDSGMANEEASQQQQQQQVDDNTLPDYEGMQRYAGLFQSFNQRVLGSEYDASAYCPKPRTASATTRRPRAAGAGDGGSAAIEDVVRDAAARNAWNSVTIPQLKEYLAAKKVSAGSARRKAELVELAMKHPPS